MPPLPQSVFPPIPTMYTKISTDASSAIQISGSREDAQFFQSLPQEQDTIWEEAYKWKLGQKMAQQS